MFLKNLREFPWYNENAHKHMHTTLFLEANEFRRKQILSSKVTTTLYLYNILDITSLSSSKFYGLSRFMMTKFVDHIVYGENISSQNGIPTFWYLHCPRIEPEFVPWEGTMLSLNYQCKNLVPLSSRKRQKREIFFTN